MPLQNPDEPPPKKPVGRPRKKRGSVELEQNPDNSQQTVETNSTTETTDTPVAAPINIAPAITNNTAANNSVTNNAGSLLQSVHIDYFTIQYALCKTWFHYIVCAMYL